MTTTLTAITYRNNPRTIGADATGTPEDAQQPPTRAEIEAQLNALGHLAPWTPALDLALVDALRSGSGLPGAAREVGTTPDAALNRWHQLMLDTSLSTQAMTHEALRRRATVPA